MSQLHIQNMKILLQLLFTIICMSSLSVLLAQDEEFMEQVNGPEGIWTRTIAVHPDGSIYVCAQDGRVYKSSDQGESWEFRSNRNYFAEAMVVSDSGDVYFAGSSVFKSTDDGITWIEMDNGLPSATILSLIYDRDSNEILAGTSNNGIYAFHVDSGDTWEARNNGLFDFASMRITSLYKQNEWIYATGTNYSSGYIYRSNNFGHDWEVLSDPITGDKAFTDVTVSMDQRIFVVTWQGTVYRSDPGGINFEDVSTGLPDDAFQSIASMPAGVILVGTVYNGVFRSDDMGDNWTKLDYETNGIFGQECSDIIYDEPSDAAYLAMRNAGMFKSNAEALVWSTKNKGLYHVEVKDILITEANDIFVAVNMAGVYRFIDGDVVWKWNSADFNLHAANSLTSKTGYIFAGTAGDGVYVTTDDGDNWTQTGLTLDAGWIVAMAVGPNGDVFAGNTSGEIYRSTDDGMSWANMYDAGDEIMDLVYNPHTGTLFAAVDDPSTGGVHVSNSDGSTWSREVNGLGSTRVLSLAVSPLENKVYASTANSGIYVTKDGGSLWKKLTGNNLPNWVSAVAVNSIDEIFAGANDIYSSRDGGENFKSVSNEPSTTSKGAFAFNRDEYLYAGTDLRGVWKSIKPTNERRVHFAVKMKNEDGFDVTNDVVVARGTFNGWSATDEVVLTSSNDEELTFTGTLKVTDTTDVITDGLFLYKYAIQPNLWERFNYFRAIEWDGREDLILDTVWFSNQKDFSIMTTSAISVDGTDSRGVAWADYDNDGYEDVIIVEAGSSSRNDLFRNNRDGTFTQITSGPIGNDTGDSRAGCWGDYNNDGHVDLYVTNLGGQNNFLYKNNGDGTFTRNTTDVSVTVGGNSVGAVWADFNNDSFLDLFVANSSGEMNFLFMNNGDESFTRITQGIVATDLGDSRGCAAADYDNDGDIDLYVANGGDSEFDDLYSNDGDGTFTMVMSSPVVNYGAVSSGGSWADYNNDGHLDLYVTTRDGEPNRLYRNDKTGGFIFADPSEFPADSSDSRGSTWLDYDNDGLLDLYVTNAGTERNFLYKQRSGGTFNRVVLGPHVESERDSRGTAWGDFNNDGVMDILVANNGGSNALYRNNLSENHQVRIKLIGSFSNKSALGAKVLLYYKNDEGTNILQRRDVLGQSGFQGQNSTIVTFGVGQKTDVDSLVIYWPSGVKQNMDEFISLDQLMYITEPNPLVPPPAPILNIPQNGATDIVINPMLNWNPAGDAYQYHLKFADNATYNPLMFEDTLITEATVYDVSGLNRGTTYYWQVRAKNDAGWGSWSQSWSFTTTDSVPQIPPSAPLLSSPMDGATAIIVNPSLMWNSVNDALQYHIVFADNGSFSPLIIEDTVVTKTSYDVSGLQYDHTYYWKVRAKNDVGWGNWSSVWSFTTEQFSGTAMPPDPANPPNGQEGMPIPTPLTWTSQTSGSFSIQVATDDAFTNVVFSTADHTLNYIFVGGLNYNTTYFWRVNVTVSGITSDWSAVRSFKTFQNQVQVSQQISFPEHDRRDEFSSEDYLMIGMPGNSNALFRDVFGDGAGEKWMAYRDNGKTGNPSDYFEPYDGSSNFRFATGKAFWIIHNGTISINQNPPAATLNEFAQAEVDIHSGWNMITCPFMQSISWAGVLDANEITAEIPLYGYNRNTARFAERTDLLPVEGFYFFNPLATRTILLIPYIDPLGKPLVENDLLWTSKIELWAGKTKGAKVRIGSGLRAETGLDGADYRKPHAIADLADIYFDRPEWDEQNKFGSDVRPPVDQVEVWDFEVYTPQKTDAELTFPGIHNIPEEFEVYLIDKTRQTYQDLRGEDKYEFVSTPNISDFEFVVGNAEVIEDMVSSIIPQQYELGQNYPNPFNPSTTIPLSLPEQSDVTLKVFNLLGQEVVTLYKGTLNAGRHYFVWEGTNQANIRMPSGIYIYQMSTNTGITFAGKMVLLK